MSFSFILASSNSHKAQEFSEFFSKELVSIVAAPSKIEVAESGSTFQQNAYLKARAYYEKFKTPTLADDSGLEVSALPDELGVYSARFGGANLNDRERAVLLLDKLKDKRDRSARFVCFLCLHFAPDEVFFFEGKLEGSVAPFHRGEHGFGYDPVFFPEGQQKTLAEMPEWKKSHSHRAVAVQLAQQFLRGRGLGPQ